MNNVAIITARGGSKRIPRKNIRSFNGQPIISYPIQVAIDSGLFDEVMVSTDDEEIAEVATKFGARVPFFRSNDTANDQATTAAVIEEVLSTYKNLGQEFVNVCCIYPTAVFTSVGHLRTGYEMLVNAGHSTVFPVAPNAHSCLRSLRFADNKLVMAFPEYENARSQDLPTFYHDCGQFYWLNVNSFLESGKIYSNNAGAITLTDLEAHDIDTEIDWKIAELKYQVLHEGS